MSTAELLVQMYVNSWKLHILADEVRSKPFLFVIWILCSFTYFLFSLPICHILQEGKMRNLQYHIVKWSWLEFFLSWLAR